MRRGTALHYLDGIKTKRKGGHSVSEREREALADHIDAVNCAVLIERAFERLDKWQKRREENPVCRLLQVARAIEAETAAELAAARAEGGEAG